MDVSVEPVPGTRNVLIAVMDDAPDGFADLRDAYTLFAESRKKATPRSVAASIWARSSSWPWRSRPGSRPPLARSSSRGRQPHSPPAQRETGSMFQATIPMTKAENEEMLEAAQRLIAPAGSHDHDQRPASADRPPVTSFEETFCLR